MLMLYDNIVSLPLYMFIDEKYKNKYKMMSIHRPIIRELGLVSSLNFQGFFFDGLNWNAHTHGNDRCMGFPGSTFYFGI